MGVCLQILDPLATGQPVGIFTPQEPMPPVIATADKVLDMCRVTNSNGIPTVPTFVEVSLVLQSYAFLQSDLLVGLGTV